jgi:hypothetical protein
MMPHIFTTHCIPGLLILYITNKISYCGFILLTETEVKNMYSTYVRWGAVVKALHYKQQVVGSIPDGFIGIFQ